MKNNSLVIILTIVIIGFIAMWQMMRPEPELIRETHYYLKSGDNGLIMFTAYSDYIVSIAYVYNGDTVKTGKIDRKEFNNILRMIYPNNTHLEKVLQLQIINNHEKTN